MHIYAEKAQFGVRSKVTLACTILLWMAMATYAQPARGPAEPEMEEARASAATAQSIEQQIRDYTRQIEEKLKPELANAHLNRGDAYRRKGDTDQAVADYSRAVELKPDLGKAYVRRGYVYATKQDDTRALQDFTKAIEMDPGEPLAYSYRGFSYLAKGNYDQAISDYTKVIELRPDDAEGYVNRAYAALAKGDYARAVQDYSRAIDLRPGDGDLYGKRALARHAMLKDSYDQVLADMKNCEKLGAKLDPKLTSELGKLDELTALTTRLMVRPSEQATEAKPAAEPAPPVTKRPEPSPAVEKPTPAQPAIKRRGPGKRSEAPRESEQAAAKEATPPVAATTKAPDPFIGPVKPTTDTVSTPVVPTEPPPFKVTEPSPMPEPEKPALAPVALTPPAPEPIVIKPATAPPETPKPAAQQVASLTRPQEPAVTKPPEPARVPETTPAKTDTKKTDPFDSFLRGQAAKSLEDQISDYTRAIRLDPDNAETYKNRAALYLEQKNYDLAWADVRKSQQLGGTVSPDFIKSLEKASARSSVSPDAAPTSKPAVSAEQQEMMRKTGAKTPEALDAFTRARETKDLDEQIKLFTKAVDLDPGFGRAFNCRGDAYALKGDYEQAIKDYTKAIELMPTLAVAFNNRGVSYIKKFEHVRAIQDFDKAIEMDPALAGAYYNRGDAYGYIGDYDRALRDFTKAIELKPDDPDAYQGRAMAYYQKRNYDEAWADVMMCKRFGGQVQQEFLQALSAATKRTSTDTLPALPSKKEDEPKKQPAPRSELTPGAELHARPLTPSPAIKAAEPPARRTEPVRATDPKALESFNRGNASPLLDDQITWYSKAIECDSKFASAWRGRGTSLLNRGDYDRAVEDFTRAIELQAGDAESHWGRAAAWLGKGDTDRALRDLKKAAELAPDDPQICLLRAIAYSRKGDTDRAIIDYTKYLDHKPNDTQALLLRGKAYGKRGESDRAVRDFSRAIDLNPDATAYLSRAMAYFDLGSFDKVQADVRVCQRLGGQLPPEFLAALERTANKSAAGTSSAGWRASLTEEQQRLLRQRGTLSTVAYDAFMEGRAAASPQSQMEWFNRAIELDSDFAQAYAARGELWLKNRDYARAIEDFDRAIALQPDDDAALVGRGSAREAAGDYERAIRDFNRAILLKPDNARAYYCRGLACGLKGDAAQAMKDYTCAIELKPDLADAYQQRAVLHYDQRAYGDAWADIQTCRKLGGQVQPDFLAALSQARGRLAAAPSRADDAEEIAERPPKPASWFGRTTKLDRENIASLAAPTDVNPQAQAAVTKAASARDLNDQIEWLTKAIKLDPKFAAAYRQRGDVYMQKKQPSRAIEDYTQAIHLKPDFAEAYAGRAAAAVERNLLGRALDDAGRAIQLQPDNAEAHRIRGVVLTRMGDYDRAIRALDRAIELNPKLAVAYFNRAQACYGRRNYDEAWASVRVCQQLGQQVDPAFTSSLARASGRPE